MNRRKKKRVAFRFYVILLVGLGLFGYGAYSVLANMVQRTAIIESGGASNQYAAEAVIVRKETLKDAEGLTRINYFADEGQLVLKGNTIAEVYSTGYSKTDENKLLNARSKIKSYHKTKLAAEYKDATLARLDSQILDYARELELMVHGKAKGNLVNLQRQMETVLTQRQTHLRSKFSGDQNLNNLYDEEASLVKQIAGWTNTHLAKSDCIVSFYTDGYENALSTDTLDTITAAQVRSVLNGEAPATTTAQRGRTPIFREVQPSGWYLLLLSHDVNWKPVDGQTYKVQLAGFEDKVFDAVVESSARSGSELLVRMSVAGDVRPVLNVRTTTAEVGETYVSGLKVPLNALYYQNGTFGVVLTDGNGLFVPIEEIVRDNKYAIIQPQTPGALREGQKIRVF